MTIDDKLDRLLEDMATVKAVTSQHTTELFELKEQLQPVFFHVTGLQVLIKTVGGLICLGTLVVGALALWK